MKKIGVLTSGGDAPGMNACIRAVVRTAIAHDLEPYGIYRGYEGMIDGEISAMTSGSVANILQRGGTILKSARSQRFRTAEGMEQAYEQVSRIGLDGLVLIGGDGTFKGANSFSESYNIPVVGVPCTIDNDMFGTDFTIGYDSALNTVVGVVDKIRDTAASHNRLFIVEVMGRDAGFIALRSGIATGAEAILVPEVPTLVEDLIGKLETGKRAHKTSGIVLVAEGDDAGGAYEIQRLIEERVTDYEIRVSILGHLQRGGNPSAMDRVLASNLGNAAIEALLAGRSKVMVGQVCGQIRFTELNKAVKHHKSVNGQLLELAEILSI